MIWVFAVESFFRLIWNELLSEKSVGTCMSGSLKAGIGHTNKSPHHLLWGWHINKIFPHECCISNHACITCERVGNTETKSKPWIIIITSA